MSPKKIAHGHLSSQPRLYKGTSRGKLKKNKKLLRKKGRKKKKKGKERKEGKRKTYDLNGAKDWQEQRVLSFLDTQALFLRLSKTNMCPQT